MPTTADYLNDLVAQKDSLAKTLADNGVEVGENETFSTLVPKATGMIEGSGSWNTLTNNGTDFTDMFRGRSNFSVPLIDTSKGVKFKCMFWGSSLKEPPLLDTSNGEDFTEMFRSASLSTGKLQLDVSKAITLNGMFGYSKLNIFTELLQLHMPNVTVISGLFSNNTSGGEFGDVNMPNVTSANSLFQNTKFTKIGDISLPTKKVGTQMLVDGSKSLQEIGNIDIGTILWDRTFRNCSALHTIASIHFNEVDLSLLDSLSQIGSTVFEGCTSLANITVVGVVKKTITLTACPLTVESAKSVINALYDHSGTNKEYVYSVLFSETTLTLLNEEGATAPGNITWLDYAYNKGWNC